MNQRCRTSIGPWLTMAALATIPLGAQAGTPLYGSRMGGVGLIEPTTDHPASAIYNPATLGLTGGTRVYLFGGAQLANGSIAVAPFDSSTGEPVAGDASKQSFLATSPLWAVAASSTLSSDSLVFAISAHRTADTISLQRGESGPFIEGALQGPGRYQGVELSLSQVIVAGSAAIKITDGWHAGLSFRYLRANVSFSFVRDVALEGGSTLDAGDTAALDADCGGAPCGYGNDLTAEGARVAGASHAFGFALGIVGRIFPGLRVGAGYVSPFVDPGRSDIAASGGASVCRAPIGSAGAEACALQASSGSSTTATRALSGRGQVVYQLPGIFSIGASWQLDPRLTLSGQFLWTMYGRHDKLDVRLTGAQLRDAPPVPDRIVHYRGFQDSFGGEIGVSYRIRPSLDLQAGTMVTSSAVRSDAVSAIAIDNWTVDLLAAARWRVWRGLELFAGYSAALMPTARVDSSAFHPSYFVDCVDQQLNIDRAECQQTAAGKGLASSAGSYIRTIHRLGLGVAYLWR